MRSYAADMLDELAGLAAKAHDEELSSILIKAAAAVSMLASRG
jgi:hypothetical protein